MSAVRERVVLLVGGVGGAKLALGLARVLPAGHLTAIINTADDMEHLGLHISPDVDTVTYTLADIANPDTGWGLAADTFRAMDMVSELGGPDWFRLGDRDLGTNLLRTSMLRQGKTLTEITLHISRALGVTQTLLPMTNHRVRTMLDTDQGTLSFQEYFVREGWQPVVKAIRFDGCEEAEPDSAVARALDDATAIIFAPSNPFLSIDPILSISGIRQRIIAADVPRIAVSPIIGGQAVKGPTAKLMHELNVDNSPLGVARYYENLLDAIILDNADSHLCAAVEDTLNLRAAAMQTYMQTLEDKQHLAEALLDWIEEKF